MTRPGRMRRLVTFLGLTAALQGACSTEITLTEGRQVGIVEVRPFDAAGECVMGLRTEFSMPDGSLSRGNNAFNCSFATAGPPGTWTLTFTAPAGYTLAPAQENSVSVSVRNDETARVVVNLVRE
jgi:hypothetical protein